MELQVFSNHVFTRCLPNDSIAFLCQTSDSDKAPEYSVSWVAADCRLWYWLETWASAFVFWMAIGGTLLDHWVLNLFALLSELGSLSSDGPLVVGGLDGLSLESRPRWPSSKSELTVRPSSIGSAEAEGS